jgi:hypothetical protein
MDPEVDDWTPVLEKLSLLKRGWPNPTWTWDGRFNMLASSFPKVDEMKARASAAHAMPYAWDLNSVQTAPEGLRIICDRAGGLRAGQMLMAGKAGGLVIVGLWWPWGGGGTITLRLGLGEHDAMEEPFPQVRDLFDVRRT